MKVHYWSLLLALLLVGCFPGKAAKTPTGTPSATPRQPEVTVVKVPDAQAAAGNFLEAWKAEDYNKMYDLLTPVSQDATDRGKFTKRYQDVAINLTLQTLEYEVLSSLTNPLSAQVAYRVTFHTAVLGDLTRDMVMNLSIENGIWKVQWDDGMIMPELKGGNTLGLEYKIPGRGNIYDRKGSAIVAQADAVSLGVIPGDIVPEQEGTLVNQLSKLTGKTPQAIRAMYDQAGANWYVAIGETSSDAIQNSLDILSGLGGLVMRNFKARYYYDGGIASQSIGYVLSISKEQLEDYQRKGYSGNEKVGYQGLEKWGENYLAGKRGATLYVIDPSGQVVTRLAQVDAQPSMSIYTTLDKDLQEQAQRAMEGFRGAAVVMERDTGRILAIVSSPTFDPNIFEPTNYNSQLLNQLLNNGEQPQFNRATQSGVPLGSVFKVITMSAALESGLYNADTTYDCGYQFTELPGFIGEDWTVAHEVAASGKLTLPEGLMRSCNPYFWHIGLDVFRQKGAKVVSDMARAFGLGKETGIGQVSENTGNIQDPLTENDAVQMAIGQGTVLVTPLQVVDFVAAIGNGGTLYRPQLVDKIAPPDGDPVFTFKPEPRGNLPLSPENLKILQDAMRSVVENPRGTAHYSFTGIQVPIYGKTGTAQNPGEQPHAWFAGYTNAQDPNRPDVAIVVLAENAGEGSEVAAPIFRRIIEIYYQGKPQKMYPWEASFYVTKTPTPLYTETPVPADTETPTPEEETPAP
jgi:penicillin-binding protein 2